MPRADEPWKAIARVLVLSDAGGAWRYAIHSDVGVVDGVLGGVPRTAAPEEAQAALLAHVAEVTGEQYSAVWQAQEAHWWTAEVEK